MAPTIVCAIDRSEASQHAVRAARWLAQVLKASVTLVHTFDEWDIPVPPTAELLERSITEDDIVRVHRGMAESMLREAATTLADVDHSVELIEGAPVHHVLRVVRERDAKLLVAGTAARAPIDHFLAGSVAHELAVNSPCPVVPVRADSQLEGTGPVLAAYDGSEHSRNAARVGAALAARMDRKLVLMHAVDPGDEAVRSDDRLGRELFAAGREALEGLPDDPGLDLAVEISAQEGKPVEVLTSVARERDAALVVAGSRGRGPGMSALLGSVSAGLVRSTDQPVVVVPA